MKWRKQQKERWQLHQQPEVQDCCQPYHQHEEACQRPQCVQQDYQEGCPRGPVAQILPGTYWQGFRNSKILNFLKHNSNTVKIFSDKKIFTVNQVYDHHNDRWLAETTEEVKGVFRMKYPVQVMVLGILGSDRKKMPPTFSSLERNSALLVRTARSWGTRFCYGGHISRRQLCMDPGWCPIPHSRQGADVLSGEHGWLLAKGLLAPVLPRPEPFGLFLVEQDKEGGKCHSSPKCGVSQGQDCTGVGHLLRRHHLEGMFFFLVSGWGCHLTKWGTHKMIILDNTVI